VSGNVYEFFSKCYGIWIICIYNLIGLGKCG
jgi:hypothetical protein